MSTRANDLRVQKTLDAIHKALRSIVIKQGFDAITIGEITRVAKVNRTTFYRHYRDKFQAMDAIIQSALKDLNEEMGPADTRSHRFSIEEVPKPLINLFRIIETNAALYRSVLNSSGRSWFQARLRQHVETLLRAGPTTRASARTGTRRVPSRLPREIVLTFSATLLVAVSIWWLENGRGYDAVTVATWLRQYFLHGYLGVS